MYNVTALIQEARETCRSTCTRSVPTHHDLATLAHLSGALRRLATAVHLEQGDLLAFQAALRASGIARATLLAFPLPQRPSEALRYYAKGAFDGLVDAILVNDVVTARRISASTPRAPLIGREAPQDFYMGMLLECLVLQDPRSASPFQRQQTEAMLTALKRFEPRTLFVKSLSALVRLDASAFSRAWAEWADERAARHRHDRLETAVSYEAMSVLTFSMALGFPRPQLCEDTPNVLVDAMLPWCWSF